MPYRLILFDLDGTLLTPERVIHPRSLERLEALKEQGVMVTLASGRSVRSAAPYAEQLQPNAPFILLNGALVRWYGSGEDVFHRHLPRADAIAALEAGAKLGLHVNVYVDEALYIEKRSPVSQESERKDGVSHTVVGDLIPFVKSCPKEVNKLLFIGPPQLFQRFSQEVREVLEEPCAIVNSEPEYFEVLPPNISKGSATCDLARWLGLSPTQVIAFGDSLNDLEMIRAVGMGVAMGNAHPELKAKADVVIGPHDTDAIASFLEQRFDVFRGALIDRE